MRHFLTILALLIGPATFAEDIPPSPIAKTTLVIDAPLVKRNQPIQAGVTFTLPPHWHLYWQNPGDSGLPTKLEWTLPEGITAGPIEWPLPERITLAGLVNYGYSNEVTLPVTLTPSRDGVMGEVQVKASWLVCKDICIPESAELRAMLNNDAEGAKRIEAARATVPLPFTGKATFTVDSHEVSLTIGRDNPWGNINDAGFFPIEDGLMANDPLGRIKTVGNELTITSARGIADIINTWHGVLYYKQDGKQFAYDITAQNTAPVAEKNAGGVAKETAQPDTLTQSVPVRGDGSMSSFALFIALAFVGGLILNIMPCVLPILALKALALAKKSQASKSAAIKQGVSYTAGVVVSFLLIAGGMLALKASGAVIGWGFQLQNPAFVGFLAVIMFLVAANLQGIFELPVLFGERATGVDDTKAGGSFFTGVLAVLVATPCTAPFMATAIGATLTLPTLQALLVFASLGLGMASPFLLISVWPAARRLLPKPGAWMVRFKQLLAVPMLLTGVWLVYVLVQLVNPTPMNDGRIPYSAPVLQQLRDKGEPVLLDATAAWCLSCKVNERVALKPESMQQFFREKRVTLMVADWTSNDPAITALLASFQRNGVPLYVYYPPHGEPVVLPQILTPSIVKEAINRH